MFPQPAARGRPYHEPVLTAAAPIAFVSATHPERARAFYQDALGLRFVADEGFALVFDLAGVMLRVTRVDQLQPQPFTVLGWRVDDLEATVRELTGRGVAFERFPGMEQDELGIWRSPSGAGIAWFRDPDGNVLSITRFER
jgi:catechol 2,3-dioxygenase-like lactoylglutathione lyase family enzyme